MIKRNIVVIGASTGGFEALKKIIKNLPSDFQASIFIVWHMSPDLRGILPDILNKLNSIHAANACDREPILPNRIYVAPPDYHLLIEDGCVRVTHGPKENRFRPAVDPLFRSAAYTYRNRVIGIILSGGLDDGTAGLWRIKSGGGMAIVQDPLDAEAPSMPESALREVNVDYCVPVDVMASLLVKLTNEDISEERPLIRDEKTRIEINIAAEKNAMENGSLDIGILSPYSCPECNGVLSKITDGKSFRFRCHTGHAYSANALMSSLSVKIEDSLYGAIRGMDESIMFLNQLGDHFAELNELQLAAVYFRKAIEIQERSVTIRNAVHSHEPLSPNTLMEELKNEY
ncbi:chemotaxis protein CheB [Pedobacter endophyticus]|uniref:protein-glutamate methylesterase n=1 Tax=Pedobacter endophyticus TaxID=2789740 RepID=A0A7U3Q4S6_9SPHI|nr:chemotaxis protein CheB [Pedobacter endophyticus]QPH38596.1 chemotaxis protein CheB [Pedobacter endophyticus]